MISYEDETHKYYEYSEEGGYLTKEIDRLGNAISYVYDEESRIIEEHKLEGFMQYFIIGIILVVLGAFLLFAPISSLYEIWENIPSPIAPRIGGGIGLVMGVLLLFLQIGEWLNKF